MRSPSPSLQSPSFPRVTSKAKAKAKAKAGVTLFTAAMLICCWAWGLQPAVARSAFGFEPNAHGPVLAVVQPTEKILVAGGFTTLMPNGGSAVTGNRTAGLETDGGFTLTASPSTVNPGAAITVNWTAPDGRPANDWLGLYKVGDPDTAYSAWQYTAGAPSGITTFTAPSQTGQYEFRYFTDNSYNRVATSNPVTVAEVAVTFSLNASPSIVDPGTAITVTWTAPDGRPANDWLGFYKVGDPDTGYSAWHYTGGTPSGGTAFTAPSQAGQYEFRYFTNNSYTKVATSNPVTVGGGSVGGGNYPDTSIPLSSDTTVTPDAAPSNVTSINVSTSADFHGTLEGNPATGVVRVTNAHPARTYTVTVKAFDSGGTSTTKTFALTVTTPATCVPISFAPAVNLGSGGATVGDFNGDGKQDLAVTNGSIWLGDGHGNFAAVPNSGFGGGGPIVVGDFNGDGKQDLAAGQSTNNVSISLGDGTGRFGAATNFGVGGVPRSIAIGDFNNDGKQDLVTVLNNSDFVLVLLGDGAGSFGAAITSDPHPALADGFPVAAVVWDGRLAVAMDESSPGHTSYVEIMQSNGDGSFRRDQKLDISGFPQSMVVGNFNGGTLPDLAVVGIGPGSILINLGGGEFAAARNFPSGVSFSVAVGDFNGDGKQDLVARGILLGDGNGNFAADTNSGFGTEGAVAVGDFNGDGMQDLAVVDPNLSGSSLSTLLRNCAAPTNYSLTASPSTVNPGQGITVTWTAPDGRPANDWIGLYKVGDPDMGFSAWQYTAGASSGSTTFNAPSQPGQYEFRYFTNNSYTKAATSNQVTVSGSP